MKDESRTAKSLKNAQVSMFYYVIQLILGFWSRKVFLDYLGVDILGLDTTASNLFGFLNLAELGVGMAVTYFLYKPLNNNDYDTINKIVALQGWLYRRVALVIIIGALILMAFFPYIFAGMKLPLWYAYATFSVMLFGSMLGYFINYKSIVLNTDQKGYKVTRTTQGFGALIKILQIILLPIVASPFIFYLSTTIISTVFGCLWLNYVIKKEYPWLNTNGYNGKALLAEFPDVLKKTKQLFIHRITGTILFQISPLLIYAFSSLSVVGYLGNYTTIISKFDIVIAMVFSSIGAAIGSLIATGDRPKIVRVFWELYDSRFCIVAISLSSIFFLAHPFISLWIGEQYVMGRFILSLLLVDAFIKITRTTVDNYISGYGLFQDVWAPCIEGIINISCAISLSLLMDFKGVLIANIISQLIIILGWKPYMLFRRGLNMPAKKYFIPVAFRHALLLVNILFFSYFYDLFLPKSFVSYFEFAIYALIVVAITSIVLLSEFFVFSQGIRDFTKRVFSIAHGQY